MGQCYSFLYGRCLEKQDSIAAGDSKASTPTPAVSISQESTPLLAPLPPLPKSSKPCDPLLNTSTITTPSCSSSSASTHIPTPSIPIPFAPNPALDSYHADGGQSNDISSKYKLEEKIGIGSTSTCYKAILKATGEAFACKVIDKRQVDMKFSGLLDQFHVEISVLQKLRHPNIIHLADVYETNEKIYMVMEIMSGGELFDYVVEKGTLSEEEASIIVRKITSAVAFMHSLNIIHRDLKPENLLLTSKRADAEIKIIDFGLAKEMTDTRDHARSFLGTKGYLAPEMLLRHAYDKSVDIWALGVIVFVLLCGCLPFDDDSSRIPSESIAKKRFTLRFPSWATNLSPSAKDILQKLLDVDPKTRFTAEQALAHPWVSGKTVIPNNYLQSPCLLGERRNILRSPETPHMRSLKAQMVQANGGRDVEIKDLFGQIHEEVNGRHGGGRKAAGAADGGKKSRTRKYSI